MLRMLYRCAFAMQYAKIKSVDFFQCQFIIRFFFYISSKWFIRQGKLIKCHIENTPLKIILLKVEVKNLNQNKCSNKNKIKSSVKSHKTRMQIQRIVNEYHGEKSHFKGNHWIKMKLADLFFFYVVPTLSTFSGVSFAFDFYYEWLRDEKTAATTTVANYFIILRKMRAIRRNFFLLHSLNFILFFSALLCVILSLHSHSFEL